MLQLIWTALITLLNHTGLKHYFHLVKNLIYWLMGAVFFSVSVALMQQDELLVKARN